MLPIRRKLAGLVLLLAFPAATLAQVEARDKVYYPDDTENVVPLTKKLVGNVLLDQKAIWTSPFHVHKQNAKWWLIFGGATAALLATDTQSSQILSNSKSQVRWGNRLSDIGSTYTVIPIVGAFYGLGALTDNAKARETGVLGGEALLDGLIVVEVMKVVAERRRPNAGTNKGEFLAGGASFPSGHSIAAWSLASVIAHEYSHEKWVPFVAYGLAGVVSASRFVAQQHYASDVVAGSAMGWFLGTYVYRTHEDSAGRRHGFLHPSITPEILPGSGTYAVGLNFDLSSL